LLQYVLVWHSVSGQCAGAGDPLALLYNDTSVLENHHCTVAFQLMQKKGCNVLESFGKKKYHAVRRTIVDLASLTSISTRRTQDSKPPYGGVRPATLKIFR